MAPDLFTLDEQMAAEELGELGEVRFLLFLEWGASLGLRDASRFTSSHSRIQPLPWISKTLPLAEADSTRLRWEACKDYCFVVI